MGFLKFWYVEARNGNDPSFWGQCLERFKRQDPDDEIPPERPAHEHECSDDKEDHHQNTTLEAQHNLFLLHLPQGIAPKPDSPPRDDRSRGYDPEGVGHNLRDSLGIFVFGLGPRHDEAKAFFQLFNNARDFLEDHFRRT
eukprot:scaffold832_cov75-Skeletonema_dohrnii-CCMP3373.AAC.16